MTRTGEEAMLNRVVDNWQHGEACVRPNVSTAFLTDVAPERQ
jgi:hypothetical protein